MKKYKILFWSCTVTIATLSSWPSLSIPVPDVMSPDKIAHFLEYAVFAFLYYKFREEDNVPVNRIIRQLCIMLICIPVIDEVHQLFIPGRDFSFYDMLADTGGFLSVITFLCIKKRVTVNA